MCGTNLKLLKNESGFCPTWLILSVDVVVPVNSPKDCKTEQVNSTTIYLADSVNPAVGVKLPP